MIVLRSHTASGTLRTTKPLVRKVIVIATPVVTHAEAGIRVIWIDIPESVLAACDVQVGAESLSEALRSYNTEVAGG